MHDRPSFDVSQGRRSDEEDARLWERFRGRSGEAAKASAVHRLKIAGRRPEGFSLHMRPVIPRDELRGEMVMKGVWRIGMDRCVPEGGVPPWDVPLPSRHYADRLHRFDWLTDLLTQGEAGADRARFLVDDWIRNFGRFDGFSWRPGCAADRVWNWMRCGAALFEHGDAEVLDQRLDTLSRQIRHISALIDDETDPVVRWRGLALRVANALCLDHGRGLSEALDGLEAECTAQFFPDGGHVSRAPTRGLRCLADLITLKDLLTRSEREVPDFLTRWIERAGGMVAFFHCGDGALPPFHDGDESWPDAVAAVLDQLDTPPRRFMVAPKSGFHKLVKQKTWLVLDAGSAPAQPYGDAAHCGALGFELHDGDARLVTSCGWSAEVDLDFQEAVRRTSAHSTLMIGDQDACRFVTNEETRLLYPIGPEGISAKRLEEEEEIWLDAQHGGYKASHGFLHRRRLFMAGNGDRLTGEDSLARPVSAGTAEDDTPIAFAIRFHLHPTVRASATGDGFQLISDFGPVWRFKSSHAAVQLEDSIYLARGIVERSQQIVLTGSAEPNSDGARPPNCIRWAFLRG